MHKSNVSVDRQEEVIRALIQGPDPIRTLDEKILPMPAIQPEITTEPRRMVGSSACMRRLQQEIRSLAAFDTTLVLQGETGTGKELAAHLIHFHSTRRDHPFVTVCCTSLCESLLESELFGHEKGAFTGATGPHQGVFERAHGGILFLDEIGAASPVLQERLLRVLQERTITRVGGHPSLQVDFRLVVATHTDLLQAVCEGSFRKDLYYRLNVITLEIPPLRDRTHDIPELVEHFLGIYERKFGKREGRLSQPAMEVMMAHSWPGNVRELEHTIERAVLLSPSPLIGPECLKLRTPPHRAGRFDVNLDLPIRQAEAEFERFYIEGVLRRCRGHVTQASRQLGISRKTLYNYMQRCDINRKDFR